MPARSLASVLLFLSAAWPLAGQRAPAQRSSLDQAMDQLFATQRYREVRVSPDGKQVAWTQDKDGGTAIYVAPASGAGTARRISALASGRGATDEGGIAWSRDGRQIAFLSDAAKAGQRDLYVAPAGGGSARRLTRLRGFVASPQFAPDGRNIALLYTEGAIDAAGPLAAKSAPTGVIGEEQVREQRLTLVDAVSGRTRQLTPPDLCMYEYDWSPDGHHLVTTGAAGNCDNNWYLAKIWSVDAATGDTRAIYTPATQIAIPRWSPDGTRIAFVAGLMSDEPITGGDLHVIPATGGDAVNLTPGMKAQASWIAWLPGSDRLLMAQYLDGHSALVSVSDKGGELKTLWSADESVAAENVGFGFNVSLSSDATVSAAVRESYAQPPEVWAGPIGAWKAVTHANDKLTPRWGTAKSLHWTSEQFTVQGWLIFPTNYQPQGKKYPMVTVVHGGPVWATSPAWPETYYNATLLSSEGYFVFYPNPRGGQGWGQAFTQAVVRDIGGGDLRDILAGIDEVIKTYPVDADRVGITGLSYGGYFSMWAPTQTTRFKASVSMGGLANWQSYYGQNGIDQWMIPFFGSSVYDDPEVYEKSSPIKFIKRSKTPTLIMVGEGDIETPPPQSFEYWHALKTLGVPTQMIVYPREGHMFANPVNRRDVMRRMMEWFNTYLKAKDVS
ncbi:MAG: S9 family peptidase [Gemmatimonadaceae bacterium]